MKNYIIVGAVVLVGGIGAWFLINNSGPVPEQPAQVNNDSNPVLATSDVKVNNTNEVKTITNVDIKKVMSATLQTNKGDITIEFYKKEAPNTVANFLKLAQTGFYDGAKFHRVIKGFMIQGGDPLSKDDSKIDFWGQGGPGYKFADEINAASALYKTGYKRGVVAMANSGPNTNGSQFFIMHQDYPLPPSYTIFARVTAGQDVVDAIAGVVTVDPGIKDRPVDPIIIKSVSLK